MVNFMYKPLLKKGLKDLTETTGHIKKQIKNLPKNLKERGEGMKEAMGGLGSALKNIGKSEDVTEESLAAQGLH